MVQHESAKSMPPGSGLPVRTCIGCRERALATDLLRVVAQQREADGYVLVLDPKRRLPGRGAWLHPDGTCLTKAERRRAFGRALRVSGQLDLSALSRMIEPDHAEHQK